VGISRESLLHLHYELRAKKNQLHPASCYILVGINRELILIISPPCSLLGIQWNHFIGESRSRAEESWSGALQNRASNSNSLQFVHILTTVPVYYTLIFLT